MRALSITEQSGAVDVAGRPAGASTAMHYYKYSGRRCSIYYLPRDKLYPDNDYRTKIIILYSR